MQDTGRGIGTDDMTMLRSSVFSYFVLSNFVLSNFVPSYIRLSYEHEHLHFGA